MMGPLIFYGQAVFLYTKFGGKEVGTMPIIDMIKTEYNMTSEEVQKYMNEQD